MRLVRAAVMACCAGLIAAGCTSDLQLALEGKRCNADKKCVPGYRCDVAENTCVPMDQLFPAAGSDGRAGEAPTGGGGGSAGSLGGSASGGSDSLGSGGSGGGLGLAGDAGIDGGAAGGPDDMDGGVDGPPDASDGCAITTVFRDADGDSFGAGRGFSGCPQPGWVTNDDDCGDQEPLANPTQTGFFGVGFDDPSKPGLESFDYDCSGIEEGDPDNTPPNEVQSCNDITDLLFCMGEGYLPDEGRAGEGINSLCGSRTRRVCLVRSAAGCSSLDSTLTPEGAFRCR